ncbi:MAG: hypothetical protein JNM18_25580 [Planctomycetaceae bacterium]|nr:hypothetical protein [Planctomycetaceae bacterium]
MFAQGNWYRLVAACGLMLCAGCLSAFDAKTSGVSPLAPLVSAPASVTLDVVFLHYAENDEVLNRELWQRIDEQQIPPEVRAKLLANGLRAGVLGAQLPPELEQRMLLTDKPRSAETELSAGQIDNDSPVRQRSLQVQAGRRTNILCVGEQQKVPELSLLVRGSDGEVSGKTYRKVSGLFVARAYPNGDGSARIELTPEIEHGDPQRRYDPSEGVLRVDFGPARETLESLKFDALLSPGQMLIVSSVPERTGSLGRQLLTSETGDKKRQKLLMVRLGRTGFNDSFQESSPSVLGETVAR